MRESSRRTLTGFFVVGVALFATILTGYLLRRAGDPSAYAWAPTLLDPRVAIAEAVSLLVACFASVGALRWSRSGRPGGSGRACIPLVAVLAAGAIVLGVRAVALPSTLARAGLKLELPQAAPARANAAPAPAVVAAHLPNPTEGKRVYLGTCAACHAPDGSGVKGQGQNLRDSDFFKDKTDEKLLAFVKVGRQPFDPESKLHLAMPARGGNPALTDANLLDSIAYVRELQKLAAEMRERPAVAAAPAAKAIAASTAAPADQPQMIDGVLWMPHTILAEAAAGPSGTARAIVALQKPGARGHLDSNVRRFFVTVVMLFGVHSLYLVFGMGVAIAPFVQAARGRDPSETVAMAAVYWISLGAIGLVLIPALFV